MPLGEASVVQCSKTAHTLLQHLGTIMDRLPTLVIVAGLSSGAKVCTVSPSLTPSDNAVNAFDTLDSTLRMGLASGLPVLLVAPRSLGPRARQLLPGNAVVDLPIAEDCKPHKIDQDFARAVVVGVLSSVNANGWLILPADIPMLKTDTLQKVAAAMESQSIAYPQYRQMQGHPIGFSPELFSELIQVQTERDLLRLMSRYPSLSVDVDDPGILMRNEFPNIPGRTYEKTNQKNERHFQQ